MIEAKVEELLARLGDVEEQLGKPETMGDQKLFRELSQEHSYLSELKETWERYRSEMVELDGNRALVKDESDEEILAMAHEEIERLEPSVEELRGKIETLLVPPDPRDNCNVIMELRAGTGGDEAAIFVGDCVRMYQYYATKRGWQMELLSSTESDMGGYKEFMMVLSGPQVFRMLQHEAGTHRVQRVPETETQGRVHTSAITVAILVEPDEDEDLHIDPKDLKIDTYRASGAGGQHVNTTDSAVRITHMPTGTVVYCSEERSQHKNKDKAMRLLKARISEEINRKKQEEISSVRSAQVGTGDRSGRIRTYNFPQGRVTDHRINLTLYKLDQVMSGELDCLTEPLVAYFYAKKFES